MQTTSTTQANSSSSAESARRGRPTYLPAIAGVGYLVAWITGLAAWPANLGLNATGAQIATSYRAHAAQATTQYLLVEGVAGVLLAAVLGALLLSRRSGRWSVRALPAALLGAAAAVTSVVQCVIGLLIVSAADDASITRCADLFGLVNRLDGVKMLALAGAAAYLAVARTRVISLPRWLRAVGGLLAVALTASGVSYLALAGSAGWTAYISGPLLLLWVTGTGAWLSVRRS